MPPTPDSNRPDRTARFSVTPAAHAAARRLRRAKGDQAMVLSWPAGVAYMPVEAFHAGRFDAIIGHVARCPVYADIRQVSSYPCHLVLDVARGGSDVRPALQVRRDEFRLA